MPKPVTKTLMYQWLWGACDQCRSDGKQCRQHTGWKKCKETLAAIRRLIRESKGKS